MIDRKSIVSEKNLVNEKFLVKIWGEENDFGLKYKLHSENILEKEFKTVWEVISKKK